MIHFYSKRKIFFAISAAIFLIGIIGVIVNGVQLDIQFKGGAILKYTFEGEIDSGAVADISEEKLGRLVDAQIVEDIATGEKRLVLNLAGEFGLEAGQQDELDDVLKESYPEANFELSESSMVEPFMSRRFMQNGITAVVLSGALMVGYIWFAFRKIGGLSAGVMGLLALVHDLFVVFFVYVLFKLPIGENAVAVALTIIGYSINDTIVIYDRIRENTAKARGSLEEIVDLSISQSLMRSINTNLAVTVSVLVIYIFAFSNGIDSIISFALPMAIGSVSGGYSTICIAGPAWVMWKKHKEKKKAEKETASKQK